LTNQGWTLDNIVAYASKGTYPSNAQIMSAGKDSSGDFSQTELDKIFFGKSPAPKGFYVLDTDDMSREFVDPINGGTTVVSSTTTTYGFKAVSFFEGRAAYLGSKDPHLKGKVFITQLLARTDTGDNSLVDNYGLKKCHTVNDVTAEQLNDTLPTDGLVVDIPGAGDLLWSATIGRSLIIFASRGVWAIQGSIDTGFTAQSFSLNNISSEVLTSGMSVVRAGESTLLFWSRTGIHSITEDQAGVFTTVDLTKNRISKEYREAPLNVKESAAGYFDAETNRVYWAHGDAVTWGVSAQDLLKGWARNQITYLDLDTGAFVPYDTTAGSGISASPLEQGAQCIAGFTKDYAYLSSTAPELKIGLTKLGAVTPPRRLDTNWATLSESGFFDWAATASPYAAYTEAWPEHLGAPHVDKQIDYCISFFKRTETSFVDNGSGGVAFDNPSSAMLSARWGWTDLDVGQWTAAQQSYKFLRPYIAGSIGDDFDYGYAVIRTKLDIGGKDVAVALRYDAEAGKDMHLIGYTIVFTASSSA
ncbi:MAG: hypothetical protein KAS32_10895, partial [Candidatus Peribacteraceae bacterium]|nr:hypothetical protein [Candidatus Peribacteraceae bacterium]